MGQYYLIVNLDKRQFLNPHHFGCGLKLMEFSNSCYGPLQGLAILLAHANGRGGGDLSTERLAPEEVRLVGSWAGDRIVMAGDYDDPGLWVPDDLDGQSYRVRNSRGQTIERRFGRDADGDACLETLHRAARLFFEDISDAVIRLVAKAEGPWGHPWAAVDEADDGWREVPPWGVLPNKPPRQPIAGRKDWEAYREAACSYRQQVVDDLLAYLEGHPDDRAKVLRQLRGRTTAARK